MRELIRERYGVTYALQSLSVVLKRLGFTPQTPPFCFFLTRAPYETEVPPDMFKAFGGNRSYPNGKGSRAKQWGNAEIWLVGMRRRVSETGGKVPLPASASRPKGQAPVVHQPRQSAFTVPSSSAINNQAKNALWMPAESPAQRACRVFPSASWDN